MKKHLLPLPLAQYLKENRNLSNHLLPLSTKHLQVVLRQGRKTYQKLINLIRTSYPNPGPGQEREITREVVTEILRIDLCQANSKNLTLGLQEELIQELRLEGFQEALETGIQNLLMLGF